LSSEHVSPLMNGVILLIEDNAEDVELFRLAVAQSGSPCQVVAVQFAKDAIKYLGGVGEYADQNRFPKPPLIVLDLSLPGMSGLEFLTWAKGEPPEKVPPIVVLSYSQLELNRHLTEKLGAKAYFVKSPDLQESVAITKNLLLFDAPPSRSV
jgi:CheY-like chemotaxis protein